MRLYQQLILFMLAATVLPVAGVGFWILHGAETELLQRIESEQSALASGAAQAVAARLWEPVNGVARSAELIDWEAASDAERIGGLKLLYQQSPSLAAVALARAPARVVAGPVDASAPLDGHPGFDDRGIPSWLQAIDLKLLKTRAKGDVALSAPFALPDGTAALAMAVRASDAEPPLYALGQIDLASLSDLLVERAGSGGEILDLVGPGDRVLVSSRTGARALEPTPAQAKGTGPGYLVSRSALPGGLGLSMVSAMPKDLALAPVRAMRRMVLACTGLTLLVLFAMGALFTRRINRRLAQVAGGAEAFALGDLSVRLPVSGQDELAELATTFNRLGAELETARARLLRWNDDLKQKVDEATAELRAAQAQLLEAQKLAAVGQLGAGVAHEINNPLAGILGHTQLLLLDRAQGDPDFEALRKIEQSAKRCKEITQNLLRFSQQREKAELRPMDLRKVVQEALTLVGQRLKGGQIQVSLDLPPTPAMVRGDPGHLSQVILALISNAETAMLKSAQKRLTLAVSCEGGAVLLKVEDTGKGIAPEHLGRIFEPFFTTKEVWSNVGLGLSVAYRVMSEHQGKIGVSTQLGRGSVFTLSLPGEGGPARPVSAESAAAQDRMAAS